MTVVNIVVCGAFVQVKVTILNLIRLNNIQKIELFIEAFIMFQKDNDNLIQSLSIGAYVVVTILYYFLLSNTADQLTDEVTIETITFSISFLNKIPVKLSPGFTKKFFEL